MHVCMNVCTLLLDQWISPVVTGDRPPPIDSFTLTPVTYNTAVMFGGLTDNGGSNKLYLISFSKTSVVSIYCRMGFEIVLIVNCWFLIKLQLKELFSIKTALTWLVSQSF